MAKINVDLNKTYGDPYAPLWTITAQKNGLVCVTSMYRAKTEKEIRKLFAANPIEKDYEITEIEQI